MGESEHRGGRVLVVEDDPAIADLLRDELEREGFDVSYERTGEGALTALANPVDVLVLDVQLPGISGLEVLQRLRAEGNTVRVLMLTARAQEADRVGGLELGADDYLTKPFSLMELISRIRVMLRRKEMEGGEAQVLSYGSIVVDLVRHEATVGGTVVRLTPAELRILALLIRRGGAPATRTEIVKELWGVEMPDQRAAYVHISNLRKKLDAVPDGRQRLLTVPGHGYRVADDEGH